MEFSFSREKEGRRRRRGGGVFLEKMRRGEEGK